MPRRQPNPNIKVYKLRKKKDRSRVKETVKESVETRIGYLANIYKPKKKEKR